MVVLFFLVDLVASLWPIQPRRLEWRYGAGGFVSGSLVTVTIAILIAVAVVTTSASRTARKVFGFAVILGATVLLGTAALFGMDALQLRHRVEPEMLTSFDATTARAVFKLLVGAGIWTVLGLAALRASKDDRGRTRGRRARTGAVEESRGAVVGGSVPPRERPKPELDASRAV